MAVSWLPGWPVNWPDFVATYQQVIPREWPRGLWSVTGEVHKHHEVLGEILAYGRQLLEWILRSWLPQNDSEGLFLDRWETVLSLAAAATVAERQNAILAAIRNRGTLTIELLRAIVAPAFGNPADLSEITVCGPTPSDIAGEATSASDPIWWFTYTLHIYQTGSNALDEKIGDDILRRIAPAWCRWQISDTRRLLAGMQLNRGVVRESA